MKLDPNMPAEEYMRFFGNHAGNLHAAEGMPMLGREALIEWAEAHRKARCRICPNDDACAEWQNHGACPATLRREFKRAYRKAYENRIEA